MYVSSQLIEDSTPIFVDNLLLPDMERYEELEVPVDLARLREYFGTRRGREQLYVVTAKLVATMEMTSNNCNVDLADPKFDGLRGGSLPRACLVSKLLRPTVS